MSAHVDVFYSTQSAYCYFLIDRLLKLAEKVEVRIRPVLGGVLRIPEAYAGRGRMEADYFNRDAARTAAFLGLPFVQPDPSPIAFRTDRLWTAEVDQPRNEYLQRLFVGAVKSGQGMAFLDRIIRRFWDGSLTGWDREGALDAPMREIGLDHDDVQSAMPWTRAKTILDDNADAMYTAGHWGVPLMAYDGEPFYGQDRFDQLVWSLRAAGKLE